MKKPSTTPSVRPAAVPASRPGIARVIVAPTAALTTTAFLASRGILREVRGSAPASRRTTWRASFASTLSWSSESPAGTDVYTFTSTAAIGDLSFAFNNASWAGVGFSTFSCAVGDEANNAILVRRGWKAPPTFGIRASGATLPWSPPWGLSLPYPLGYPGDDEDTFSASGNTSPIMVTDAGGRPEFMVYLGTRSAVTAADPATAPTTVTSGDYVACQSPSGFMDDQGRAWVVFIAESDTDGDGVDETRVFLTWSDESGTWATPVVVDGGTAGTPSFPTIAVSGMDDANGNGRVLLVTWRVDDGANYNIHYRAVRVDGTTGFEAVGGFTGADADTGDTALTTLTWSSGSRSRARDPAAWCTSTGAFFIGYTVAPNGGSPTVVSQHSTGPCDAVAWSGELTISSGSAPDFVFGAAQTDLSQTVAVWEENYTTSSGTTATRIYGATCDLSGSSSTWAWVPLTYGSDPFISDSGESTDDDQLPCCVLQEDGTLHLFLIRSANGGGSDVRIHYQRGTLS